MKQFYKVFSDEKVSPLVTQLTWNKCLQLLPKFPTITGCFYLK